MFFVQDCLVLQVCSSCWSHPHLLIIIGLLGQHHPHLLWCLATPQQQSLVSLIELSIIKLETKLVEAQHELLDHESQLIDPVVSLLQHLMCLDSVVKPSLRST